MKYDVIFEFENFYYCIELCVALKYANLKELSLSCQIATVTSQSLCSLSVAIMLLHFEYT